MKPTITAAVASSTARGTALAIPIHLLGAALVAGLLACGSPPADQAPPPASAAPAASMPSTPTPTATSEGTPCPQPPPCGDDCSNQPFEPTNCWTTEYGPARANVILGAALRSPNMLYCDGGSYALCFFSGPPTPTGTDPTNPPLPCVLELGFEAASCTCQAYSQGPYFVDINAIENLGVYYQTVNACGPDGSGCANIANCGPRGDLPGCAERKPAPVCTYVAQQNPQDPTVSLIPGADLISTFSLAMDGPYQLGSTPDCNGLYAGCMTAPCSFVGEKPTAPYTGQPIQCRCPTYSGPFQVGQNDQQCTIASETPASFVWSAAYTVANEDTGR